LSSLIIKVELLKIFTETLLSLFSVLFFKIITSFFDTKFNLLAHEINIKKTLIKKIDFIVSIVLQILDCEFITLNICIIYKTFFFYKL